MAAPEATPPHGKKRFRPGPRPVVVRRVGRAPRPGCGRDLVLRRQAVTTAAGRRRPEFGAGNHSTSPAPNPWSCRAPARSPCPPSISAMSCATAAPTATRRGGRTAWSPARLLLMEPMPRHRCAAIAARSCFRLTRPAWRATALTSASHATRALRGDLPHQRRASPYSHVQATVAELRSVRLAAGRSLDIGLHERKLGRPSAQRRWSS